MLTVHNILGEFYLVTIISSLRINQRMMEFEKGGEGLTDALSLNGGTIYPNIGTQLAQRRKGGGIEYVSHSPLEPCFHS